MARIRVPVTLVAICLAGLAGLACGGDDDGSGPSAEALAKVRASDYARAVNLHGSDVPYFEPIPDEDEEDSKEAEKQGRKLTRCIGAEEPADPLAEVTSGEYGTQSPGQLLHVSSTVAVAAQAEDAARAFNLIRSRRAERCLRAVYVSAIEGQESSTTEVGDVSVSRLRFPATDIGKGYGYRFTASVTIHGSVSELTAYRPASEPDVPHTMRLYFDDLGFVVGSASIDLTAVGSPTPVSRTLEHNLLRVLHERATERTP